MAPELAFEVERVFDPVAGVDEGEVDEGAAMAIAVGGVAEGVAGVDVAMAPGVDGAGVPLEADVGQSALDAVDVLVPALALGDLARFGDLAGFIEEGFPIGAFGFAADGLDAAGGVVEIGDGGEKRHHAGFIEGLGDGLAWDALGDEPAEVVAAQFCAAGEDLGRWCGEAGGGRGGGEGCGPAELGGANGELDDDVGL